jgi:hypothetical protein
MDSHNKSIKGCIIRYLIGRKISQDDPIVTLKEISENLTFFKKTEKEISEIVYELFTEYRILSEVCIKGDDITGYKIYGDVITKGKEDQRIIASI